jgi:ABC-type polysaccharide/polyol phosphate transport system ATPase subunit
MDESNIKIALDSVSKSFNIGYKDNQSVLARVADFFSGKENKKKLSALKNVSFNVSKGEILGIIGKNGSGKSTLLRLIAGIYVSDEGTLSTEGKIMYINGFNYGTKPKLTMRENIFLSGSIMGLTRNEVDSLFDNIVDFSGLKDFVNTKVYQFSSGMVTRLNFSIFIHCVDVKKPDIILLDEILSAGGDIDFNNKAELKMREFIGRKAAVLVASHLLSDIKEHCDRVLWIEDGVIVEDGKPVDVISHYKAQHKA